MSSSHLSAAPNDPYQWRESVLSTRSLSYLSQADALGSPGFHTRGSPHSRVASINNARLPARTATMSEYSEDGLEMSETRDRELKDIPELPESVAESPLFTLPREIRDRIYNFCLTAQNGWAVQWPTVRQALALQPRLLQTCKIVYREAAPLLYSLNNMTFHHPSDANMFVKAVTLPALARHISQLSLHIKAQDTRLWMPYLTSKDSGRSLKADYPNLRELHIRYRSNKWQHSLSPEANMKLWAEDSRLDEIIDGLRHVFLPNAPKGPRTDREFEAYISNHSSTYPLDPSDPSYRKQWLDIHKARIGFAAKQESTPSIKVVCACRVHAQHFTLLTATFNRTSARDLEAAQPGNGTGPNEQSIDDPFGIPTPVKEGEPFRGFTYIDLRGGVKKLYDPEAGSANVAHTPFADKKGILLSLEIHSLDPKRGSDHPLV